MRSCPSSLKKDIFMKGLLVLILFSPLLAFAQSPFDGTWVIDTNAQLPQKPTEYLLAKGMFRCVGCNASPEIKADGHDQKVGETGYWDTESVRVVDTQTVEIVSKKAGKTMFAEVDTVSPDGGTLTQLIKDTTEAEPVTIEILSRRVAPGPRSAHALSGSWQAYKIDRSRNGSTITYKCTADGFSAETPLGERFDAKFDGRDYPIEDDPGHTTVSVKLLSQSAVDVTSKRNGKVVGILHLVVLPGGKSINVVFENRESNTESSYQMQKQP